MTTTPRSRAIVLGLLAACAAPTLALAQSEPEPLRLTISDPDAPPPEYPVIGLRALSAASPTRTNTPVEEIPQSIAILPRAVLEDQQVRSVGEALRNASGVVPPAGLLTPAFDPTTVRGFAAEQLIDGFTQYYNPGDREGTINIERIEVLKGTSGLLFGGGSGAPTGGIINLISKEPQPQRFAQTGVTVGSQGSVRPFFDLNQPLTEQVLFRMTGEYEYAEGYVDVVETERYNFNPTLQFKPDARTTLSLGGKLSHWSQPEYQGLPATGTVAGDFRIDEDLFIGPDNIPDSTSNFAAVTAGIEHQFDSGWSGEIKARYARSDFNEKVQSLVGADGFTADQPFLDPSTWALVNAELFQEQEEFSVIANASWKFNTEISRNTLLVGMDYSHLEDQGFIDSNFLAGGSGVVDLANPVFGTPYVDPGPGVNNQFVTNETGGVFAQLQSSFFDDLHLLGAVRLGHVGLDFNGGAGASRTSETRVLPRLGAVYDLTDEVSVFASYATGMRGQPFLNFVDTPQPETSQQIEAGVKLNFAEALTGQIAVYQIDRQNVAVTDVTDPAFRSITVGAERSRGVEVDLVWQPLLGVNVLANYAYTSAEFSGAQSSGPEGNRLPGVPEHAGRLWASYAFQDQDWRGFSIGAGVYAQSEAPLNGNNRFFADAFYTVDAAMSYEIDRYRIGLTVKNLTDNDYFQYYGYFDGRVQPSQGITAWLTTSVTF